MKWYVLAWKRAGDFYGRSRRKEYWMFSLFHVLVSMLLAVTAVAIRAVGGGAIPIGIYTVYALLAIIPSTSCTVRRLHDTDKSGWWLLISMIPFVGLILIVFLIIDGDKGSNQYGPDPKQPERTATVATVATVSNSPIAYTTSPTAAATAEDYAAWQHHLAQRNPLSRPPGATIKDEYEQFMADRAKNRPAVSSDGSPA
jgi:uncharacterized membrane protein YhaH (DUF805 family)